MFKELWVKNVRGLLKQSGLSTAEAARLVGTSKQYLSTILSESEPGSTKEAVMERLCFLLHTTPARLFTPQSYICTRSPGDVLLDKEETELPPVELAIMAERHFLAGEYAKAYYQCRGLLERREEELSPVAKAQVMLLGGKSGFLAGYGEHAIPLLKEALRIFQKRLATQPGRYLALCMDCYRYLGLSSYARGDYQEASRWLARVCALATRHCTLSVSLESKVEEAVSNWLRSTVKQGDLREFLQAAQTAKLTAQRCDFANLQNQVRIEELFCFYPLAVVHGTLIELLCSYKEELSRLAEQDIFTDALQFVHYVLLLLAAGQYEVLDSLRRRKMVSAAYEDAAELVVCSIILLEHNNVAMKDAFNQLSGLQRATGQALPGSLQALNLALQGLLLESMGLLPEAHSMWQSSLGVLKEHQEVTLYIYFLDWYLKSTAHNLPDEERAITVGLLSRALERFAPDNRGESPWQ